MKTQANIGGFHFFLSYLIVVLTVLTGTVCFTCEPTNNYILQLLLLLLCFCVSVCLFVCCFFFQHSLTTQI